MKQCGLGYFKKKVISREITDCPNTINKVESKELKISGEEGVIELVKDYEMNLFK
jgi:hypothetical protein